MAKFQPGQSGNPKGRPRRSISDTWTYFNDNAPAVRAKLVEAALNGDMQACKFILERIIAPLRNNPVHFDLPKITSIDGARQAMSLIIDGQTTGELTSDEADGLIKSVQSYIQLVEVSDIEARLKKIEERSE